MDQAQPERLHTIDRWHEEEIGPLDETMLGLRKLMAWVFEVGGRICCAEGEASGIRVPSNVKEMPADIRVIFEKHWGVLIGLLLETDRALKDARNSGDPTDWKALRTALLDWFSFGVSPVPLIIEDLDGAVFSWHLGFLGDDITGHREDGRWSFLWNQQNGLQWWYSPVIN